MVFALYGTALCTRVLECLKNGTKTVSDLVLDISTESMDNRDRRNLDRRIRTALSNLLAEDLISHQWSFKGKTPVIIYQLKSKA